MAMGMETCDEAMLVRYGSHLRGKVGELVEKLKGTGGNGRVRHLSKLELRILALGCHAISDLNCLLNTSTPLIHNTEVGKMFRWLFDEVLRAVTILSTRADCVASIGAAFKSLSPTMEDSINQKLSFVVDAARNKTKVDSLNSWITFSEGTGFQRCLRDPSFSSAQALSRSSSGNTSGQATPLSQAGEVAPAAATFARTANGKARSGRTNSGNRGAGGHGGRKP